MNTPLRIAVLGLTHDHVWGNLAELVQTPVAELAGAADPNAPLLERFAREYNRPTYEDPGTLLEQERPDAVFLFSDNAGCVELAELAASRGLHILVEKPIAANLAGADRMLAAARQADVRLMVNWPFAWWPQLQHAITLADAGELGDLWQVKYRAAHAGPDALGCSEYFCDWLFDAERNGAGAFIDYCCYGAALARRLLGVPGRVWATAGRLCKEHITVDDNGILVMTYPRATAISEGTWDQIGNLSSYVTMIYGTKSTLFIEPRVGGRLLMATAEHPDGVPVVVPDPPEELRTASAHFVHAVARGEPFLPLCDARLGRDAQEILQAGLQAAASGQEVALPLAAG